MVLEVYNKMLYIYNVVTSALRRPLWVLGISLCLLGAFLMFTGGILGDRTTGIATVMGINGIGLIATHREKRSKGIKP